MEKKFLYVFWVCMLSCACVVLTLIWYESVVPAFVQKFVPTLFVIGFANFLLWASLMVNRGVRALER